MIEETRKKRRQIMSKDQNPPSAPVSLLQHGPEGGVTTRARLAAEGEVLASPVLEASDDLDFLDLTFFGEVSERRLGIIHGPSMGLVAELPLPLPLPPQPGTPVMSRPLRAFVIANISLMLRDMGDMSPGIGGWPGASMNNWLPE